MSRMDALGGDAFDNTSGNEDTQQQRLGAQPGRDLDDQPEVAGAGSDTGIGEGDRGTEAGGGLGIRGGNLAASGNTEPVSGADATSPAGRGAEHLKGRKAKNLLKHNKKTEDDEGAYEDPNAD